MSEVNHPKHYNQGKIEVIEFIEDKELGFHLGNAVKYVSRAGKKNPAKETEDLKKAIWYIERQIELLNGDQLGSKIRRPNEMNRNVSEPVITKVVDKPTSKVESPANQKELLNQFLNPQSYEAGKILTQAKKEEYKRGHEDGWNQCAGGCGVEFVPELHVDNSVYGYASTLEMGGLNDPNGHLTILRDRNKWAKDADVTFVKITPLSRVEGEKK